MKLSYKIWKDNSYYILLGLTLWGATVSLNWPGHYSVDSMMQLIEGMTGQYVTYNPPLMAQILAFLTRLGGHGAFMAVNAFLFFLSVMIVVMSCETNKSKKWITALLACIFLNPIVLIYNGIVWKDVFSANLSVLAIVVACIGTRKNLVFSFLAVFIAAVSINIRPQAIVVLPILSIVIPFQFYSHSRQLTKKALLGIALLSFGLCSNMIVSAWVKSNQAGYQLDSTTTGFSVAARFDIAGMVYYAKNPEPVLSKFLKDPKAVVAAAKASYSPERVDTLEPFSAAANNFKDSDIFKLWFELARAEPAALIRHKVEAGMRLLGTRLHGECLPGHVGVVGETVDIAHKLGINYIFPEGFIPRDASTKSHLFKFMKAGLFLFTGWLWFILCICMVVFSIPKKSALLFCLGICGVGYTVLFLLVGVACDFRYQYFTVECALIGILYLLLNYKPTLTHSKAK